MFFSIFSQLFSKQELKNTKNPNKRHGQLFIINVDYFENLYEPIQHLSQL